MMTGEERIYEEPGRRGEEMSMLGGEERSRGGVDKRRGDEKRRVHILYEAPETCGAQMNTSSG